jgi:mono/diheme cytochrome c family protein
MDDVKKIIYAVILGFLGVLLVWGSIVYVSACGFSFSCRKAATTVERTPVPTLIPATLPVPDRNVSAGGGFNKCQVTAETLIGAWVSSGYSDTATFTFTDNKGQDCQATFKDVQPLFLEGNLWYPGASSCSTCHNSDVANASANMDLSSYQGMLMGALRNPPTAKGQDIFGGGNWLQSKLHDMLFVQKLMPLGRPPSVPPEGPTIFAGTPVQGAAGGTPVAAVPTSNAGGEQVARPSNPGGPGDAVNLTGDPTAGAQVFQSNCVACHGEQGKQGVTNPGSTDGTVPQLNPIDPTLVSTDFKTFAYNLDLFIQHGSTPEGSGPAISMPAWGDKGDLTQQQIADVIAYVTGLNGVQAPAATAPSSSAGGQDIARPSNPGGPGDAVNLTGDPTAGAQVFQSNCVACHGEQGKQGVTNPGSTDGTVPQLNPIDPTLVSTDFKTFAYNLDLFIQHGSTPEGSGPAISMPAWGDKGDLTQQQIADVIAYVISLNK